MADGTHPNVLMSHLSDAHNVYRKDGGFQIYLDQHFANPLCACGCSQKVILHKREFAFSRFAPGCAGLNRSRSPGCIDFYLHKGMDVDEAIETFRLRQAVIAKGHSTEELRDKLSELNSGNDNPASVSSIMKRTGKSRQVVHNELSGRSSGINNGFYGKTHDATTIDGSAIKIANARAAQAKFVSRPELVVWGMLYALGVEFDFQVVINRYTVDFLSNDIIVDVFGDYWHSAKIKMKHCTKPEKDALRIEKLRELGYRVEIIWESEIFKDPASVVAKLKRIFCEN